MNLTLNKFNKGLSILLLAAITLPNLTGCTGGGLFNTKLFRERAAETPEPNEQIVDKSFFVDSTGKPKTFLCAWAPEIGRGYYGEAMYSPFVNAAMHCNVEFEITEDALVAKMINPSFLNDRSRWTQLLSIPIAKHFYYERDKDKYGRETNEWIENSSRSHWTARPKMKLALGSMHVLGGMGLPWGSEVATSVDEIEWDQTNNFLGFSMSQYNTLASAELQVKWRVNFLKFEHDASFAKVPYHQENSRLMNILHVLGRLVDGMEPELYAAHWDLRKPTRVYLNGVPKEHQNTVVAAVDKWNRELRKVGAIGQSERAFVPVLKDLKHPFDLRYPSITWISDRRISSHGPLGIGMAHADVRNGKIIWGGIVLFGGMIEGFINAMTPTDSATAGSSASATADDQINPFNAIAAMMPATLPSIPALQAISSSTRSDLMNNISVDHRGYLSQEMAFLARRQGIDDPAKIAALQNEMQSLQTSNPGLNQMVADLIDVSRTESQKSTEAFTRLTMQNLMGSVADQSATSLKEALSQKGQNAASEIAAQSDDARRASMMRKLGINGSSVFADEDLTAENQFPAGAKAEALKVRSFPEVLQSVVMNLTLHEFGHMIGLGHQFKENILPEKGTVPSTVLDALTKKATKEQEYTNYTSVMGYMSGRTEMMMPIEQLNPGPHDNLVLHYLYGGEDRSGQYSIYNSKADKFDFKKVPDTGRIPEYTRTQDGEFRAGYFPACNDFEASLAADPFCNRFDRGSSAVEIVGSYFDNINDNLLTNLYSLVGGGANEVYAEYRLWNMAFKNFSRVRMFYDEMRRRLRSESHLKGAWNRIRTDKDALFGFSRACTQNDPIDSRQVGSEDLRTIFKDSRIVDLCRANTLALKEFSFFLNLPQSDYTKIDHNNRYMQGGYLAGDTIRNSGHAFGSWYQMSNLPLKIAALYTLTSANSYLMWGGLWPNPFYDNEENRYLYRTLYPVEYTKMISDTVQNNLRFAATGKDDTTTMGRTVLATGWLLPRQRYTSNDSARLPREYNELLDQQTEFKFSIVAVLIEATKPDAESNVRADHYKKFTANVYDFVANKSAPAREIFLLPKGDIFVWANGMFVYPITKLKFYSGTSAYVMAYKVSFDDGVKDDLINNSLKLKLMEKHNEIASYCVNGFGGNGLLNYFDSTNTKFEGFKILSGISEEKGKEKLTAFYTSLDEQFDIYENGTPLIDADGNRSKNPADPGMNDKIPTGFPIRSMRRICDEAIRGVGQISAAAAMTNGFWLGITLDYVEK